MANEKMIGNSNRITRAYLDSLLVETRYLDAVLNPSTEFELFGEKFATPVMTAALSHLDHWIYDGAMRDLAQGAKDAGAVMWIGMEPDETVKKCIDTGARVIEIIKPYKDREYLKKKMEFAQKAGAFAVGVDIDHPFGPGGTADKVDDFEMAPIQTEELAEISGWTDLPMIIKGVLSVQDAQRGLWAGVDGIVLSHHNNRIEYAVPPLMAISDIYDVVGGVAEIFVDDEIATGMDAFKAIALGAAGVCVGRPLMTALKEEKAEGVRKYLENMRQELAYVMACTGCAQLGDIEESIISEKWF